MEITIQEKAREMLEKKLADGEFLRVSVVEGGCAGMTYGAELGTEMRAGESVVYERGTIRVVANEATQPFLRGLNIDFSDSLIGGGLQLTNISAKSTCGCGASFNLSGYPVIDKGTCKK
ncbi:MAG: iron-sulfur cluster assembly accessory protein [Deltaproteobacteria bacterium]